VRRELRRALRVGALEEGVAGFEEVGGGLVEGGAEVGLAGGELAAACERGGVSSGGWWGGGKGGGGGGRKGEEGRDGLRAKG
jgi:hypothetical protein